MALPDLVGSVGPSRRSPEGGRRAKEALHLVCGFFRALHGGALSTRRAKRPRALTAALGDPEAMPLKPEDRDDFIRRYEIALSVRLTPDEADELFDRLQLLYSDLKVGDDGDVRPNTESHCWPDSTEPTG